MAFFDRIAGLEREHASFAIATVVGRRSPVSSHLGDRALIFADGRMEGFVGGSCSRDIVRRQAVGAIGTRRPLLLQIRPEPPSPDDARAGDNAETLTERVTIPMSCSSEGAVDVYIEPRVPLRLFLVVGFTPVAEALARLATALEYAVVRVVAPNELRDLDATAPRTHIIELRALRDFLDALDADARRSLVAIVASQGHYDELALEALLTHEVAFTGLLASRRRAATVFGVLAQQGVAASRLATVANPVGLDIGARSPGEVAVSILAQLIAREPVADTSAAGPPAARTAPLTESDPVCGMDVETFGALYQTEHAGRAFYFCGANCRMAFLGGPASFLGSLASQ